MQYLKDLRAEIDNDPETLGYAGKTHEEVADLMNTKSFPVNREKVTRADIMGAIDDAQWGALSAANKLLLLTFVGMTEDIDPFGWGAMVIKDIFDSVPGNATMQALAQVRKKNRSRIEVLLDRDGVRVKPFYVQQAREL